MKASKANVRQLRSAPPATRPLVELKKHERVLRWSDVHARTGLGRSAIYARLRANAFPKPFPLDTRKDGRASVVGFAESEIERWIQERMAARTPDAT